MVARWPLVALLGGMIAIATSCSSTHTTDYSWDLRSTSTDGRTITLTVNGGACDHNQHIHVTEDSKLVTIRVGYSYDSPCTKQLVFRTVIVRLASPLDARSVRGCRPNDPAADCPLPAA